MWQAGEERLAGLRLQRAVGVELSQDLIQHKSMFMAKSWLSLQTSSQLDLPRFSDSDWKFTAKERFNCSGIKASDQNFAHTVCFGSLAVMLIKQILWPWVSPQTNRPIVDSGAGLQLVSAGFDGWAAGEDLGTVWGFYWLSRSFKQGRSSHTKPSHNLSLLCFVEQATMFCLHTVALTDYLHTTMAEFTNGTNPSHLHFGFA